MTWNGELPLLASMVHSRHARCMTLWGELHNAGSKGSSFGRGYMSNRIPLEQVITAACAAATYRAAPGVQTLSTIPMADAAVSSYNQQPSLTVSGAQSTQNDVFSKPGPSALSGCKADVVTGMS